MAAHARGTHRHERRLSGPVSLRLRLCAFARLERQFSRGRRRRALSLRPADFGHAGEPPGADGTPNGAQSARRERRLRLVPGRGRRGCQARHPDDRFSHEGQPRADEGPGRGLDRHHGQGAEADPDFTASPASTGPGLPPRSIWRPSRRPARRRPSASSRCATAICHSPCSPATPSTRTFEYMEPSLGFPDS